MPSISRSVSDRTRPVAGCGEFIPIADIGQKEKALETLKKAEAAFQEIGMDYWLRRTQEVLERVQG